MLTRWLVRFETALAKDDINAAAELFAEDCHWRDLVAFTWNIRTCEGRAEIKAMLAATLRQIHPINFTLRTSEGEEGWFSFETAAGRGIGHLRIKDEKCWTLLTTLQELKGFEERAGRSRPLGVEHGAIVGRKSWLERRQEQECALGITDRKSTRLNSSHSS